MSNSREARAFQYGVESAKESAKPLTSQERRDAIKRLHEANPDMSDRQLAKLVAVSPSTVAAVLRPRPKATIGDQYTATVDAHEVARRVVTGIWRLYESRTLTELVAGDRRVGKRLARALRDEYGNDAITVARHFAEWAETAVAELNQ